MGTRRLVLVTGLAFLVEALVLVWFPLFGVRPRLLPPLAALLAMYVGFRAFGVAGMILAPLCAILLKQFHDCGLLRLWRARSGGLPVDCWGEFFPPWQGLPPSKWPCWPWQAEFLGCFSTKRPPFGENGWPAWAS